MKRIRLILFPVLLSIVVLGTNSCTDQFEELNTDKTKLTSLDASGVGNAFAADNTDLFLLVGRPIKVYLQIYKHNILQT